MPDMISKDTETYQKVCGTIFAENATRAVLSGFKSDAPDHSVVVSFIVTKENFRDVLRENENRLKYTMTIIEWEEFKQYTNTRSNLFTS